MGILTETLRAVFQKLMWSGKTGAVQLELDPERSTVSDYLSLQVSTASLTNIIYSVPTGKRFQLKTLIITNHEAYSVPYRFYDSQSTTTPITPAIILDDDATLVLTGLDGLWFDDFVMVDPQVAISAVDMHEITVGGLLDDED